MSKRLSNQGGAIRSFIIIAIILALGTITAVYFVQKRGEQARRDQAIAQADKMAQDEQKSDDKAPEVTPDPTPTPTPTTETPAPTETAELPATGPESALIQLLMAGILAGAITAYVSSRRVVTIAPLT